MLNGLSLYRPGSMAPKKWQQLCLVVQLTRDRPLALAVLALALVLIPDAAASTTQTTAQAGVGRVAVSAVKLPDTSTVVRRTLTEAELAAPQRVRFTLNLRNFKELDARITRGEVLSLREMQARYFPAPETWTAVANWAAANGYSVERADPSHMTVSAVSTAAHIQSTLHARFSRVIGTDGAEYTAATQPPVLPAEIGSLVTSVSGLRPDLRPRNAALTLTVPVGSGTLTYMLSQAVTQAYGNTGLTGAGQTIVVAGGAKVDPADLTAFWAACGMPTTLAQFTENDPAPAALITGSSPSALDAEEENTMDIEWASAMAPGAKILYISSLDPAQILAVLTTLNDPTVHQITESGALSEAAYKGAGITPSDTPYYASLAAMGITFFASSGDYGSTTDWSGTDPTGTGGYDPNGFLAPAYPASDPYVTGVGGTVLDMSGGPYSYAPPFTEGGWGLLDPQMTTVAGEPPNYGVGCSTGGLSLFFARPSWQQGPNLAAGSMRSVPDVAAVAAGSPAVYLHFGGAAGPAGGTSLSSPVWGGMCALINEARANAGLGPIGLLGPRAYPLMGSSAFNSLTTGANYGGAPFTSTSNNGAYGMGAGYNMVTGLGSPNIANLITALDNSNSWLVNLSARAYAETGANQLIAGFVTTGTSSKSVLIRGDGPSLAGFSIPGYLADPQLTLVSGSTTVASATSWAPSLTPTFTQVGAFGFTAGSHDTALLESLAPGAYTAQVVSQTTNNGVALAEVYDADSGAPTNRLVNLSARAFVGSGANILIGGFVIAGTTPLTVVIRGDGPALTGFGVPGALANTVLTLSNSSGTIATNSGWSNAPVTGSAAGGGITIQPLTALISSTVGAFALTAGSGDSGLVATLPPGAYTAQVAGADGSTGVALVEIYEMR
jgi:kumamolisin